MNRRRRNLLLAGLAATLPLRALAGAQPRARVIVIGGGFGGSTCAGTLARLAPDVEITLIEPRPHFFTGPSTNAAIAGVCAEGDIVRGPAHLGTAKLRWRAQRAVALDPVSRRVTLDDGTQLGADRIVLSPGVSIRWDMIDGLNADTTDGMPHAWLGDAQVSTLRARLHALPDGATIAISAPANPYRCPPGPYERASLMAWHQLAKGRRSKILLLDAKDDFTKHALFRLGWDTLYPGLIEWVPRAAGGEVVAVDSKRGELYLHNGTRIGADLASVIPPQRAAVIAQAADLTDESGWCPVQAPNFESTRHPGIHVIGDAAAAQPMPKSAFSANGQGKLVALSITAELDGLAPPRAYLPNTCYSLLAPDYAISVGGTFGVIADRLSTLSDASSPLSASRDVRALEARYAQDWYVHITRDTFG